MPPPSVPVVEACADLPSELSEHWVAFDSVRSGFNRDIYLVRANGMDITRVTTDASSEREPAFAPDGERLAYVSDSSGSFQVHIRDLKTGETKQLTQRTEGADQPSWSADGKQLVFHSGSAIFIVDATGDNQRELARGDDNFNAYKYPVLSPNGLEVVFDRNNEINALSLAGGEKRYVVQNWTTLEETPAISRDGFQVAFGVGCGSVERIGVVPLAGYAADPCKVSFATRVDTGAARRPAWGPDNVLAYERGDQESASGISISIVRELGGAPCDVVPGGANHNPHWAPDQFKGL